jgi:two-component system response regulator GlrR
MRARVLVVDDDPNYLDSISEFLEAAGYDPIAASTFEAGKRALAEQRPDLLLLDVRLGAYNGLQFISTGANTIPAILVTGFDDPVLRADAASFGARFLVKPVDPQMLLSVIQQELENSGLRNHEPRPAG